LQGATEDPAQVSTAGNGPVRGGKKREQREGGGGGGLGGHKGH